MFDSKLPIFAFAFYPCIVKVIRPATLSISNEDRRKMSTLTRTNSHSKKPQYKDYVSFLDSYRTGKKDDQHSVVTSDSGVNFSLNCSTNNSSNSVFSDVSETSGRANFKEHFENFNNKRFTDNSTLPPKPKPTVKTEMFIEIKNSSSSQHFPTQVFEIQKIENPQQSTISVSSAAKMFEKKDQVDSQSNSSLKSKQNSFKKSSIGEISKKFENTSQHNVDPVKPPAKRALSIGEVSKVFENGHSQQNGTLHKPKNFNSVPKPFQPTTLPKFNTDTRTTVKPAILSPKPIMAAPEFPKFTPEPPRSYADSVDSALSSLSISPSPPHCASPPPSGAVSPPPPPPPLPPANFTPQAFSQKLVHNGTSSPPKLSSGVTNQQTTGQSANGQSIQNGTLDRNDPRVKKAVYGALRNMYGAYHDQANDYLATLPKNRVRKNNGLDSIIDSIASQGGLDKLNGRLNPKPEVE